MNEKNHHKVKRHYKKIAAALGGAFVLAASAIHGMAAVTTAPAPVTPEANPSASAANVQQVTPPSTEELVKNISTNEAETKDALNITATAYAPGPHDNDQWGSKTHLGTEIRPGVIAVDPRIIPLGSKVMIKYPDGSKEYAVAEDTGGAIKGHRIDVAKWTVKEANRFGVKAVKVYVLSKPDTPVGDQV